jgi:hypothetical protein
MVYSHGDGATTGLLNQGDRLVDGLRTIHTFWVSRGAAPRAVDDGSGLSERSRNAASSATRRSRDKSNLTGERQPFRGHAHLPFATVRRRRICSTQRALTPLRPERIIILR